MPFQLVEDGGEGVGEDVVVVEQFAIRATGAIGDTPAQVFSGAGEHLADATAILQPNFLRGFSIHEAAGFDDGEKTPADLGFFLAVNLTGMRRVGKRRSSKTHSPSPTPVASMTICWGDLCSSRFLSLPKMAM